MSDIVYDNYEAVKGRIAEYREQLDTLYTYLNNNHPAIYVANADKKQYWFLAVEQVSKISDAGGTYCISINGRGIRVYFKNAVEPSIFTASNTHLMGDGKPGDSGDLTHEGCGSLIRCEIFGNLQAEFAPDKISFSDLMRNSTINDADDFLIGVLPSSHFIGNFAKAASGLLSLCPYNIGPSY